jgi:periplasmic protein TonB
MSTARPAASPPSPPSPSRWRLSKRAWWGVSGAFGLGFLMFFLLWLDMRDNADFYRAEPSTDGPAGQVFEPLPTPQNDRDGRSASGLSEAAREIAANPRPAPPPVTERPQPAPPPADTPAPTTTQHSQQALAAGSVPQPIERVPPKYPSEAMRRNETGTVLVRVEVGTDGKPSDISIARSSRSRALDRAAMQAVRQWRFRPAQRDGRAVPGTVEVPFEFSLEGR